MDEWMVEYMPGAEIYLDENTDLSVYIMDTPFTIRAYEGADILKHDYRIAYYEDADELTASLKSPPKKNDHPLQFSHVGKLIRAN